MSFSLSGVRSVEIRLMACAGTEAGIVTDDRITTATGISSAPVSPPLQGHSSKRVEDGLPTAWI
jgi:hypothetical protein